MLHRTNHSYPFFRNFFNHLTDSQTSLSAAGCGFFATLSLFPALSALIPLYGLVFNVETIAPQLDALRSMLPPEAYGLISEYIKNLAAQPHSSLTLSLIVALSLSLWSASASSKSVLSALNLMYGYKEHRSLIRFQLLGLFTTALGITGGAMTIALMVAAPAISDCVPYLLKYPHVPAELRELGARFTPFVGHFLAPGMMMLFLLLTLCFLYRFAPCWPEAKWRFIVPGAVLSTLLWVVASCGFSWYMAHFTTSVYGPFGTVAAVMMWFFVSAYVVMAGAVFNVELRTRAQMLQSAGPSLGVKLR